MRRRKGKSTSDYRSHASALSAIKKYWGAFNQGFRLLPEGRGSELVREYGVSGYAFLAIIPALSRT
ncbi:hypothetical protein, partial [Pseudomonas savastanoi]